jgi:hypothetical protein
MTWRCVESRIKGNVAGNLATTGDTEHGVHVNGVITVKSTSAGLGQGGSVELPAIFAEKSTSKGGRAARDAEFAALTKLNAQ